jgi:signal transduction histidine kinase
MALRLVKKKKSAEKPGRQDRESSRAVCLLVDDSGGVVQSHGWEMLSIDPPPRSIPDPGSEADPIVDGIAQAVSEARGRGVAARRRVECSLEKPRLYSIVAAPLPGRPAGRMVVTIAETDDPQASAAEGRVIRQLGHDLRTPLTSISGAVELMQSGRLGPIQPQQERVLGMMEKGVEAMVRLIDEATAPYRKDKDLIAALGLDTGSDDDGDDPLADGDQESEVR